MTTPFPFVSGAVLTAAQMNDITNLPINDQTDSYSLVVGDAGKRVVMNVATANTVTVNDSVFTTGDTIFVANKGAGASTLTAGAGVTINSASGLVLVQHQSGQLVALSASSFLFVASDGPALASGLAFISNTPFTTASNVSLPNDTFTSTFTNYRIVLNLTALTADADFTMRLRAAGTDNTTTDYRTMFVGIDTNTTASNQVGTSISNFLLGESDGPLFNYNLSIDILQPQAAQRTSFTGGYVFRNKAGTQLVARSGGGSFVTATVFDSLTFISSVASSMTGQISVYGYANS